MTYATIEVDSKFWLAPEPVKTLPGKPDLQYNANMVLQDDRFEAYYLWKQQKSGWTEIKEEHAREFKGRTGLIEGKDFEVKEINLLSSNKRICWGVGKVAIPIKTDQERIEQDKLFEELYDIMREIFRPNQTAWERTVWYRKDFIRQAKHLFTIKRKQ
jgi:hypothetical protein